MYMFNETYLYTNDLEVVFILCQIPSHEWEEELRIISCLITCKYDKETIS